MIKSIIAVITAVISLLSGMINLIFYPTAPQTESVEFAWNLGTGWNLGNTLDACRKGSTEKAGLESETFWGNPVTTKEMIDIVKAAGFKTVRIPITCAQHLNDDYTIDEAWLDRVNEIVDYFIAGGMYAIINVHHDDAFWLITDYAHEEKAEFYVETAEKFSIPCIVWDNGGDFRLLDRSNLQWEYPEYVNAVI